MPPSLLNSAPADQESNYLVSVSDLMVGMLFLFIIILMAFALSFRVAEDQAVQVQGELAGERDAVGREKDRLAAERDALAAERDVLAAERDALALQRDRLAAERDDLSALTDYLLRNDRIRSDMLAAVQSLLRERQVEVSLDPENGILRLPESLLFDSGEAVLSAAGARALRELATVLARTLPCYSQARPVQQSDCSITPKPLLEAVLIEGHTDDVPISTSRFRDNWELASTRAINTYKALLDDQPSLNWLKNARGEDLLGVSAYEAHRPVSTAPTPAGRRLNRRIDLRFLIAAPSEGELSMIRREVERGESP